MIPRLIRGTRPPEYAADVRRPDDLRPLVEALRRGDRQALRTFLAAVVPQSLRVVRRVLGPRHPEIEDVAYEAAYATVSSLDRFRGEGTILHFARRVALLTALNVRRRDAAHKRTSERLDDDPALLAADQPTPERLALGASLAPLVRELLGSLPEPLAEAFALHVVLGYSTTEIAQTVGAPHETIRSRLRLARQALRVRALGHPKLREALEDER